MEIKRLSVRRVLKIGAWTFVILIAFAVLLAVISPNDDKKSDTVTTNPVNSFVGQGENGYLENGSAQVLVATTKEKLDEFVHFSVVNDTIGMAKAIQNGEGYLVNRGTKVLVIDSTIGTRQVRILEGEYLGESGWVPMEFVTSAR